MKNINIDTFNKWAIHGKDEGMEKGHAQAVKKMIDIIEKNTSILDHKFNFLDIGCGNGWVVRKFSNHKNCNLALGVDGAPAMIGKAKCLDKKGVYVNVDIEKWNCKDNFNIIFSMETFYYFNNPGKLLDTINNIILKNGIFILGIDHYLENKASLSWDEEFGLSLNTLSINQWITLLKKNGFTNVKRYIHGTKKNWHGTLILYAINK